MTEILWVLEMPCIEVIRGRKIGWGEKKRGVEFEVLSHEIIERFGKIVKLFWKVLFCKTT